MEAKELMIGDWVMVAECVADAHFRDYPDKIESIRDGLVGLESDGLETIIERIAPIPLTPEILKKNGFGYVRNDVNPYDDEVLSHFYLGEEGYCANMDIHIGTYNKGVFWFSSPLGSLNCIHYIHELQHALRLCNIEKEIEL